MSSVWIFCIPKAPDLIIYDVGTDDSFVTYVPRYLVAQCILYSQITEHTSDKVGAWKFCGCCCVVKL